MPSMPTLSRENSFRDKFQNLIENDDGADIKVLFESIRGKINLIKDLIKNRGKGI
jgi:hypothetical protein